MVLSEAIEDYGQFIRHELGHARTTYHAYVSWQRNFARWLAEEGMPDPPVTQITESLVRRYSYSLSSRNLRPRTIRGALHALRALFGYLAGKGAIAENPALGVRLPKKDAATRPLVTDEDLVQLLQAAERQGSDYRCVRDRAILAVLIFCGLRRQELLDLTIQAVNLKEPSLLVQQGKGQKSRVIYLCDEAVVALREWLAARGKVKCSHDYLFLGEGPRRLGERSLTLMLEEVKAIAGLKGDPRIKPHSIRHAAATRLMRNGADIRSIQAWLGHSQLQTTAMYLHTDEEQVRKIARFASLRAPEPERTAEPAGEGRAAFHRRRRQGR
jgi:site-specific recombinase XerD